MLRNILLTARRNFTKNKIYTLINVLGLAIGMACTILIFLFVYDELSYENMHQKADNIYRVTTLGSLQDNEINTANTPVPMGPTLKEEFPFVKNFVRLKGGWSMSIRYEQDAYN